MLLSTRLQTISDNLSRNQIVADIGSDHGLLPISLILEKRAIKTYAMDIAKKPLEQAKANIAKYSVSASVFPILSNGLDKLPDDVNSIVLSGMGSTTIIEIISKNLLKLKNIKEIIVAPNIGCTAVREYMSSINYSIVFEKVILENDIYYEIIKYVPGKQNLSEREMLFGPYNLEHIDDNFRNKWSITRKKLLDLVSQMPSSNSKREEFNKQIKLIDEVI